MIPVIEKYKRNKTFFDKLKSVYLTQILLICHLHNNLEHIVQCPREGRRGVGLPPDTTRGQCWDTPKGRQGRTPPGHLSQPEQLNIIPTTVSHQCRTFFCHYYPQTLAGEKKLQLKSIYYYFLWCRTGHVLNGPGNLTPVSFLPFPQSLFF